MSKENKKIKNYILVFLTMFVLGVLTFTGCQSKKGYTVTFNTCTTMETNKIKDRIVAEGEKVSKPNLYMSDEKYSKNCLVEGWYVDPEYTTEWDFETDVVKEDMMLYAKWEKQYLVKYFVSIQKEPMLGVYVKEGEKAPTQDTIVPGYKVLGYYADAGYSSPYDFEQGVTQETDIYVRLSDGFCWDGKSIVDNWLLVQASGENSKIGEVTYVENENESYARVDFGYSELPDGRITAYPMRDMTSSQILTIKYKNLGNCPGFRFYWTVKYADGTVSGQDGDDRTWDFGEVEIKRNMSEDDDWETLTIDMGKLSTINGASQWAGGQTLDMFRIDSLYHVGLDEEYVDDVILFKEISFSKGQDYPATDSVKLASDNVFEVLAVSDAQESVEKGYVFPKDRKQSVPKLGTLQYTMTDCMTYFFPYGEKQGLVSYDMSDMKIDMKSNQMLYIKYKNHGYGTRLTVRYHTTDGVTGEQTVKMRTAMSQYGLLTVNMLNDEDWNGKLESIDLIYNKKDTNNVLSVQSIYLEPFTAKYLPGINFVDDKCAGFKTNDAYKIVFDTKNEASYVEMLQDNVTLVKNVSVNTAIYSKLNFTYSIPADGIDSIQVGYQIGGKWYTETIDSVKRTSGYETVSFDLQKKGTVTKMRVVLEGRGRISLRTLEFKVDPAYSLDLSESTYLDQHFDMSWVVKCGATYDEKKGAVLLSRDDVGTAMAYFYFGASGYMNNIRLDSASEKVYVCYNNPGEARTATLNVYYAGNDNQTGSGMAGNDKNVSETKWVSATAELQGNMKEGEWAVAVFDYSGLNLFSANRNATCVSLVPGGDIYLRSIVLK